LGLNFKAIIDSTVFSSIYICDYFDSI